MTVVIKVCENTTWRFDIIIEIDIAFMKNGFCQRNTLPVVWPAVEENEGNTIIDFLGQYHIVYV